GVLCTNVSHPHSGALCRRCFYLPNVISDKKSGREDPCRFLLSDATLPRRIRHKADYFLISYSGV
ncbi:TPA: hypothetical protein ACULJA_002247, partial [Escherichia coli]